MVFQLYCLVTRKIKEIWTEKDGYVLHGAKTAELKRLGIPSHFVFIELESYQLSCVGGVGCVKPGYNLLHGIFLK